MDTILEILNNVRPDADFASSENFIEDGFLDSFDVVTLVTELDEKFGISIDGMDIVPENFKNIDSIRELLAKKGVTI